MVGAAPTDAGVPRSVRNSRAVWRSLTVMTAVVGAVCLHGTAAAISAVHHTSGESTRSVGARFWAVQVPVDKRGRFDHSLLDGLRKSGVNALAVDVQALGSGALAWRSVEQLRAQAERQSMSFIAIVPPGRPRSAAAAYALTMCGGPSAVIRCAVKTSSLASAARLARSEDRFRSLVAFVAAGPRVLSKAMTINEARRHVLVVVPLYRGFNEAAWATAVESAASSSLVDLAVAPQGRKAASTLKRFRTTLAAGSKNPASVAPADLPSATTAPPAPSVRIAAVTSTTITLAWAPVAGAGFSYEIYVDGSLVQASAPGSVTIPNLACGRSYTFGIDAVDPSGARSTRTVVTAAPGPCGGGGGSSASVVSSTTTSTTTPSSPTTTTTHTAASTPSPPRDATPPTTPSNVAAAGVGQTSITLSWAAATDNIGVTRYNALVAGLVVGTTTSTSYTFTGLACGTTYTFGLQAVDGAGNVSAATTAIVGTGACTVTAPAQSTSDGGSASANLFVSTSGNDATCARGTTSPCATFNRAFQLARIGDVIQVACGRYGSQSISANSALDSAAPNTYVTFRPPPDQPEPSFSNGSTGAGCVQLDDLGNIAATFAPGPSHVRIQSMYIDSFTLGKNITNHSWDGTTTDWEFDNVVTHTFSMIGVARVKWFGGQIGDVTSVGSSCSSDCSGYVSSDGTVTEAGSSMENHIWCGQGCTTLNRDVLFDGVVVHDIYRKNGAHNACFGGDDSIVGLTIRNSKFYNCDTQGIFFSVTTQSTNGTLPTTAVQNVLLENNWIAAPTDNGGTSSCACNQSLTFKNTLGQTTTNVVVRNNVIDADTGWSSDSQPNVAASNVVFVGNILATASCLGGWKSPTSGVSWYYNRITTVDGTSCPGSGNVVGNALGVVSNPAPPNQKNLNFDIPSGSAAEQFVPPTAYGTPSSFATAFGLYDPTRPPLTDAHGVSRPCGTNYSAGADETCG